MQAQQQRHILEVEDSDKPLFGSGVEKSVPYLISDIFAFKAKKDGTITKVDKTNNLAFITYDDGTKDIINLNPKINKNSNGGFYLNSRLTLMYNVGDTFKKNDILAKDDMYMIGENDDDDGISYATGTLAKVALASSDATYEDSSYISESLSNRMKSKLTMKKEMAFEPNTNIDYIVKIGQEVKTGDPLITFESAFEDSSINEFLDKLGSDFEQAISNLTKNTYRSKYSGKIVDIRLYYNRDIKDFSPSIQKLLNDYIKKNEKLANLLIKNSNKDSMNQINLPSTKKINSPKIKGKEVDGLLIEFYIEYEDVLCTGDKIAFYGPCKTIVSDVLDKDSIPFVVNNHNERENLDAVFSPMSIIGRMTIDIIKSLYLNKDIMALKEKVKDIYYS